jgi:hypothetical protein
MNRQYIISKIEDIFSGLNSLYSIKNAAYGRKMFNKWYPTRKSFTEMMENPSSQKISFNFLGKRYSIPVSYRDKRNEEDLNAVRNIENHLTAILKKEEDTIKEIIYESQLIPSGSDIEKVKWDRYVTPKVLLAMSEQDIKWFSKSVRQVIIVCDCYLDKRDPFVIILENEEIVHCSQMSDLKLKY